MGSAAHGFLANAKKSKYLLIILALLLVAGGVFWHYQKPPSPRAIAAVSSAVTKEQINSALTKDSDGDGLKDWEETLWQTDPKNPDTDGDGTTDGEETTQNRNPLKASSPDTSDTFPTETEMVKDPDETNLTFAFANNLFESGVLQAIGPRGEVTSTDFLEHFVLPNKVNPELLLKSTPVITSNDLLVVASNDPTAVKAYFNALYEIYATHIIPLQKRNDVVILLETLQTEDYEKLSELDAIIDALKKTTEAIQKIPVPSDYQSFATQELNYISQTKRAIEIFRNTQADPLATAAVIRKRMEILEDMHRSHQQLKAELEAGGITFAPHEGGFAFFQ